MSVDLSGILAFGRTLVADLMQDTCTVTRTSGRGAFDQVTGARTPVTPTTVYAGRCRVKSPETVTRDVEAGERDVTVRRFEVSIPFDADNPVEKGDVLTVTAVAESGDPWLVGRSFVVDAVAYSSTATARKLTVEEQT